MKTHLLPSLSCSHSLHDGELAPTPCPRSLDIHPSITSGCLAGLLPWVWPCPSSSVFGESFSLVISLHVWCSLPEAGLSHGRVGTHWIPLPCSDVLFGQVVCFGGLDPFHLDGPALVHGSLSESLPAALLTLLFCFCPQFLNLSPFNLSQRLAYFILPSKQSSQFVDLSCFLDLCFILLYFFSVFFLILALSSLAFV